VPGGPDAERLAAMSAGKIDAGVFNSSSLRSPSVWDWSSCENSRPQSRSAGQRHGHDASYIKSNRDVVKSALKGYIEASTLSSTTNKPRRRSSASTCAQRCRGAGDILPGHINTTPRKPYPTLKGLQFLLDRLAPTMPQRKRRNRAVCRHEFFAGAERKVSSTRWQSAILGNSIHCGGPARQSRNRNSEYLPQRRKGRKVRRLRVKIIYKSFCPFPIPWRLCGLA